MKKLTILFLLFSVAVKAQVTFASYGAIGGDAIDDTAAIQAAIDAENSLIGDGGEYLINGTLDFDQSFSHDIDWNGSTLKATVSMVWNVPMILIDKRTSNGGYTAMSNLTINGNNLATRGVRIFSRPILDDVDVQNFTHASGSGNSPAGFDLEFNDDDDAYGTWDFNNCDVNNIVGVNDGTIQNALGAANGVLVSHEELMSQTTRLYMRNGSITNCWGEDAQNIALFSTGIDISYSNIMQEFEDMVLDGWERRSVKGFTGNQKWTRVEFNEPDPNNPNIQGAGDIAGFLVFGAGSGATGAKNIILEDCTINGTGYYGRVTFTDADDVHVNNTTFNSQLTIWFEQYIGDFDFCGNTVASGVQIRDNSYDRVPSDGTNSDVKFGYNNTFADGYASFVSQFGFYNYSQSTLSCPEVEAPVSNQKRKNSIIGVIN